MDSSAVGKKNLKISIVTPSFNQARFIEDAIKSVLNQGYRNYEHIVIDGGSTDGTVEILKKYSHLKWISEPDEGQADALNKGMDLATGDIIGWLNSDDVYLPGTFQKVASIFSAENVDAIYSNCYFTNEKLEIKKELRTHRPIRWLSLFHCFIPSTTFFFHRKIWDEGIRFDKNFTIVMDKDFFAQILFRNYRVIHVNDYFAKFRWHADNKSLNTREVKLISAREGLTIFRRYSNIRLPINYFTIRLYRNIAIILNIYKIYKKIL